MFEKLSNYLKKKKFFIIFPIKIQWRVVPKILLTQTPVLSR